MMETKSPEWIKEMIEFMGNIDQELGDAGERVASEGLVEASEERALEVASRVVAFIEAPVEVRQVADAPPDVSQL